MAATANSFVSDQGEVEVTLSADNITAVAGFTTAESIIIDGVVRSFKRTNNPEKALVETNVTGSLTPITHRSGRIQESQTWELVIVDDYSSGGTGEWGTDTLTAHEIFRLLLDNDQDPGGLKCTPNGGAATDIETTLTNVRLMSVGEPEIDADKTSVETILIKFACSGTTKAAHG